MLDAIIHRLDVTSVRCDLNLGAELKPIVIDALPGMLLDFAASSTENLAVLTLGLALYAVKALLLAPMTGVISSEWALNQSADLLVFLPKVDVAAL